MISRRIKDEIPKTEPGIIESHATENINVTVAMMEDFSGLKLEDTLIGIEDEKKRTKKNRHEETRFDD